MTAVCSSFVFCDLIVDANPSVCLKGPGEEHVKSRFAHFSESIFKL
jgi:hypothetical protein